MESNEIIIAAISMTALTNEVIFILDWIFEGIINWVASIMTALMDAVSGMFLNVLGTDMVVMEEYFPFITKAFEIMQYTAWCILFLITIWQLFKAFGGPITEAENPWHLLIRSSIFAVLIGYAKPIFNTALDIARAPYTALMDASMNPGDFTFAGVEQALSNGLTTLMAVASIVGLLLLIILMICLGWNYFKTLLEVVERYIVVGILCYTSPLAFAMGGTKTTLKVFQSWCRMVGSQLLLLVMNVWFLRGFNSSVGHLTANGGALTNGQGTIFLWMFCALAFLKTAQKFDSILAALGLNVAQTGSNMGMELLMASRALSGFGGKGSRTAGSMFGGGARGTGTGGTTGASSGFMAGFASKFKGNSYVRDAVVSGGSRMGAGGGVGLMGRALGGMAAKIGSSLTGESISSVASRPPSMSGSIGGTIADRSLANYMPHLSGKDLNATQITGGYISTAATGSNGKEALLQMYNASMYDRPDSPHSTVTASDGSTWYQTASGAGMGSFYSPPPFSGDASESARVSTEFPDAPEGTMLRSVGDGVMEASYPDGSNSMWYNSAFYQEPDAPHETVSSSDGVDWYAMQSNAETPHFETGEIPAGIGAGSESTGFTDGVPFDSAAHEAAGTHESSFGDDEFEADGSAEGSSGMLSGYDGTAAGGYPPDISDISETSALSESADMPLSADTKAGGIAEGEIGMLSGDAIPGDTDIKETSSLPGSGTELADTEVGSAAGGSSDSTVDGPIPEASDSMGISGMTTLTEDSVPAVGSGSVIPVSDTAIVGSSLTGEGSAIKIADGYEITAFTGDTMIPGTASRIGTAGVEPGSISDTGGTAFTADSETSRAGITEGVGVMARNLGDYHDTAAASLPESSLPGGGAMPVEPPPAEPARFDPAAAAEYNQALFKQFMPGFDQQVSNIDNSRKGDGILEVRHPDGTGTAFYDKSMYRTPRGDHQTYEDNKGGKWYAVQGTPTVERRPVYEKGKPVYDGGEIRTVNTEGMKYKTTPEKFGEPKKRDLKDRKPPRKK